MRVDAKHLQRDLLYTHGYIARTLGPRDAAQYLTRLLRVDERFHKPIPSHEWSDAFFITNPVIPNAHPHVYIANRPAWLLAYVLRNYGTVVPQSIWSPGTPSDAQRYNNVPLNMPIFFVQHDLSALGLQVVHAAAGDFMGLLLGAGGAAPVGNCSTTSIRIKVSVLKVNTATLLNKYCPLLVAWLRRMDYSDHDKGPDRFHQHNHARKIGKTHRARGLQVRGSEPIRICMRRNSRLISEAGCRRAVLPPSRLARRWPRGNHDQ